MFESLIDDLREAPERLRAAPERVSEEGARALQELRHRVHLVRGESQERIWTAETRALESAVQLLDKVPELPLVGRVVPNAEKALNGLLDTVTLPEIADYDALNARTAAKAVRGLGRVDLLRVQRHERNTKGRKTVLDAVERELSRLKQPPQAA